MKKLLLIFFVFLIGNSACYAYGKNIVSGGKLQKKVEEIGFNILNANEIENRVVFRYAKIRGHMPNAYACSDEKSVTILNTIINYVDTDEELAGIIAHEIVHNTDYYGFMNGYFKRKLMSIAPKTFEKKADLKALDYMVKAGYNPVAMIVVMNKIGGQADWWWGWSNLFDSHPQTSKRLVYMYEHIYQRYPEFLNNNKYQNNPYYKNFLITSKKEIEKIQQGNEVNISNIKH